MESGGQTVAAGIPDDIVINQLDAHSFVLLPLIGQCIHIRFMIVVRAAIAPKNATQG